MTEDLKLTTEVKKQHTVPRFLLDNFGFEKGGKAKKLYTFDKHSERSYIQSVYDASTRNTFYDLENHPDKHSLEPILGEIESEASSAIRKIIEEESLSSLTNDERIQIAVFVVIQKARTYHGLQSIKALVTGLGDRLVSMGAKPEDLPSLIGSQDHSDLKNFFLETVLEHADHAEHILNKSWILYKTSEKDPYYISDNPVTLHNDVDMGFWGNLGLAVQGIQIHLPISSSLTLAFVCPSHEQRALQAREQLQFIVDHDIGQLVHVKSPKMIVDYANAFKKGEAFITTSDNTKFLNSLQVRFAEQYIFCEEDKFGLVKQMIKADDSYRTGLRPTMN